MSVYDIMLEEKFMHVDIDRTEVGGYYIMSLDDFDTDEEAFERVLEAYEDQGLTEEMLREIVGDLS